MVQFFTDLDYIYIRIVREGVDVVKVVGVRYLKAYPQLLYKLEDIKEQDASEFTMKKMQEYYIFEGVEGDGGNFFIERITYLDVLKIVCNCFLTSRKNGDRGEVSKFIEMQILPACKPYKYEHGQGVTLEQFNQYVNKMMA